MFVEQVQCVLLLEMGQMWDYDSRPKPKVWAGSVHSPVKDIVLIASESKFGFIMKLYLDLVKSNTALQRKSGFAEL